MCPSLHASPPIPPPSSSPRIVTISVTPPFVPAVPKMFSLAATPPLVEMSQPESLAPPLITVPPIRVTPALVVLPREIGRKRKGERWFHQDLDLKPGYNPEHKSEYDTYDGFKYDT